MLGLTAWGHALGSGQKGLEALGEIAPTLAAIVSPAPGFYFMFVILRKVVGHHFALFSISSLPLGSGANISLGTVQHSEGIMSGALSFAYSPKFCEAVMVCILHLTRKFSSLFFLM